METQKATKLIRDMKNSKFMPVYDEWSVNSLLDDINKDLFPMLQEAIKESKRETEKAREEGRQTDIERIQEQNYSRIVTLHFMILRIKRCLLVYLQERMTRIEKCFWEFGNALPMEYKNYMRPEEVNYFNQYKQLVMNYQNQFEAEINLSKDVQPPEDLFVSIRVIRDCEDIVSSEGEIIKLQKDTSHFIKRADIEHLLLQGYVVIN